MFIISDRVRETSSTAGSGSVVFDGAYGAFQTFNTGIGSGNTTYYTIENTTQWEVGQGVYDSSSNSLSRDIVFDSSAGGSKINIDGVSIVFCTLPADRTFVEDPDGNVFVSGVHATSGVFESLQTQDLTLTNDLVVSGDTYLNTLSATGDSLVANIASTGEITSSGFLTLIRPNSAGNFFHAYKDDSIEQTVSLHVDSNTSPLWRLGLKTNPDSQTDPPTFAYVYGSDGSVGLLSNIDNYIALTDALGFFINHDNNIIFRASSQTGVYVDANNISYPAFTISGPVLGVEDLQRWEDGAGNTLSVVDSGGKFGILKETPEYELDVEGSGRFETAFYTSGIYFQDGSFQNTALLGSVEQIEAVSGIAVYASGLAEQNAVDILTVSGLLGSSSIFDNDLTVSLGGGKTFGRYEDGDVIPSSGLSAVDVITLAVTEPIDPTVNLSSSSSVDFNQTSVSVTLNFSHTINSLGASVSSASLEFRRANTGSWTVLSTSTTTPDSFVHNFTDTAFNTDQLNYRYIVTDSVGATATATFNINPDTYSAPSISFNVDAPSLSSPESDLSRERGNDESDLINGSVSRNETYVDIQTAQWQYRADGGAWQDIDTAISLPAAGGSLSTKNHLPSETTASTIQYRIEVVDDYQTTYSSTITVNFGLLIFYGPSSSAPVTSANVRALPDRLFTVGNDTFNLNTGSTEVNFTVAIPDTETISEVLDLDALNANITAEYINNPFGVDDGGGTSVDYNVYTMTIAIPYSSNHRHQVTKG